jgi:hypothetical protein
VLLKVLKRPENSLRKCVDSVSQQIESHGQQGGSQVKRNVAKKVARRKRRVLKRLERARERRFIRGLDSTTVIGANAIQYELSERVHAINHGGIGMMMKLARNTGLVNEIDRRVHLLKVHAPYQESDHVMAHVLNMLCGGTRLEHLELLRNNEALLNAVGADSIPDPTTAGDFCRRFTADDLDSLTSAIHAARLNVWRQQPDQFFNEAVIDVDGVIVGTTGECKEGMDISFKEDLGLSSVTCQLCKHKGSSGDRQSFGQCSQRRGCGRSSRQVDRRSARRPAFDAFACEVTASSVRLSIWIAGMSRA